LIIIEPFRLKDTLLGKTILNLASNGRGGSMSSSLHKGNDKGWSWNALGTVYMGDKKHPIMSCLTQGIEANFSGDIKFTGKKQDVSAYYSYYNTTIGF
jgi:iron complex outermembrane receptor protein